MYKSNEIIHLKKHEQIEYPGDYIILKGFLACKTEEQLVYFAQPGDTILVLDNSWVGLLQFQAKTEVSLVRRPEEHLLVMLERQDILKSRLISALIARVQFFSVPVKERLNVLLYQLGREIGVKNGQDCHIPSVVTQKEMGDYISCTREYLCTVKRQLIKDGWIEKGKDWKLLDWGRWEKKFK